MYQSYTKLITDYGRPEALITGLWYVAGYGFISYIRADNFSPQRSLNVCPPLLHSICVLTQST